MSVYESLRPLGLRWAARLSGSVQVAGLGLLLALSWGIVHVAGGTVTAWPHLFYVPIMLAALPFGYRGGLVVGGLAAIACGPLMPLDTVGDLSQSLDTWLARGGFFIAIGLLAGTTVDSLRRSIDRHVADHVQHELELATTPVAVADSQTARRVRETIDQGLFHPVYQPIYSLGTGQVVAVEALTRFEAEPAQSPEAWLDQAARAGMGTELDLVTVQAALDGAEAMLPTEVALHLNVTPATLRDARLLGLLTFAHRRLVVEVTEHAVIEDYERLELPCQRLRQHGIKIAVDDAGAGFSSLRHVVRLAPEIVKLDISLTRNVRKDPVQLALAGALIQFTRQIDAQLIVEGIEDRADLGAWIKLGAHAAQGFLLGHPGPLPLPHRSSEMAHAALEPQPVDGDEITATNVTFAGPPPDGRQASSGEQESDGGRVG